MISLVHKASKQLDNASKICDEIEEIKKKREQNEIFCDELKKNLINTVGEEAVENELKSAMDLFEKLHLSHRL